MHHLSVFAAVLAATTSLSAGVPADVIKAWPLKIAGDVYDHPSRGLSVCLQGQGCVETRELLEIDKSVSFLLLENLAPANETITSSDGARSIETPTSQARGIVCFYWQPPRCREARRRLEAIDSDPSARYDVGERRAVECAPQSWGLACV